jgi:cytoskeletal protein CcmA (bactofilin family)
VLFSVTQFNLHCVRSAGPDRLKLAVHEEIFPNSYFGGRSVSMWNKREEPPAPRPASAPTVAVTPPPAAEIKKESTPVSSTPFRTPDTDSRNAATIGKAVKVIGQIFTKEDLYVDGDVEGTIESQENKVTVGPNGRVQASIKAREVIILGQVQGNVETADKVDIRKDAKLVGDIITSRISIEDGALFKGSIDIKRSESKPAPSTPAPSPPVARTPEPATAAASGAGAGGIKR